MQKRIGRAHGMAGLVGILAGIGLIGCHKEERQADQDQVLLEAAKAGDVGAMNRALQSGAHVNARSRSQESERTPLMLACLRGKKEAVQSLLAKGAEVNAKDSGGMTALMWASFSGQHDIVQHLLDKGADANMKDKDGQTAADWGDKHPAIVEMLKGNRTGMKGEEKGRQ